MKMRAARTPTARRLLTVAVMAMCASASSAAPARTFDESEARAVKAGLVRAGVDKSYEIVLPDQPDIAESTAASTLQEFLSAAGLSVPVVSESSARSSKRIVLGRVKSSAAIRRKSDAGQLKIREVSAEDDAYQLRRDENDILIAGANPRGVLYGVYAFEDFVRFGGEGKLDVFAIPAFRKRGGGAAMAMISLVTSHVGGSISEEHIAALSRAGVNEFTDQSIGGTLAEFIGSDVFPFLTGPTPEFRDWVKMVSAACRKYGIDTYVYLNEPALPGFISDVSKFPAEALGTAKRPWGGGKDGFDRTLCISSPIVQRYLRSSMKRFVEEYPDIKGVQFYNLDVSAWLCTPAYCERCRAVCKDSDPKSYSPWETQVQLIELLATVAHQARPDFQFRIWVTAHFHGRQFEKMVRGLRGHDGMLSSWTGSDRTVMIPDAAAIDPRFTLAQQIGKRDGLDFLALCELHNLEVVPRSLPFPFHCLDALQKYRQWGITNLSEIFGMEPLHGTVNAIAARDFYWNPDLRAEEYLRDLARRQFGDAAGKTMYLAWEEVKRAFDVWNDVRDEPFPFEGSQFQTKLGTAVGGLPPALAPGGVSSYFEIIDALRQVEPWREEGFAWHRTDNYLDRMERMRAHFEKAALLAHQAVEQASPGRRVEVYPVVRSGGRPTSREYAELNYSPIAFAAAIAKERCALVRGSRIILERDAARSAGNAAAAARKEKEFQQLARESVETLNAFRQLLDQFATMEPHFERATLTSKEIQEFRQKTDEKLVSLHSYLQGKTEATGRLKP